MRTSLIIPTRNAASHLDRLLPALRMQTVQPDEMLDDPVMEASLFDSNGIPRREE